MDLNEFEINVNRGFKPEIGTLCDEFNIDAINDVYRIKLNYNNAEIWSAILWCMVEFGRQCSEHTWDTVEVSQAWDFFPLFEEESYEFAFLNEEHFFKFVLRWA